MRSSPRPEKGVKLFEAENHRNIKLTAGGRTESGTGLDPTFAISVKPVLRSDEFQLKDVFMSDTALIDYVKSGDYAQAEKLIRDGADVNQQDEQGWTPLNFAAGRGDLPLVDLLVRNGAEVLRFGRDRRTPYMIALAAGRAPVVKYLREVEDKHPGEKPAHVQRKYCKPYQLRDVRKYSGWSESRINWNTQESDDNCAASSGINESFTGDKVVFIHQDFTVTESIWRDENVIFNDVDAAWQEFCSNVLNFKVPDDLDLIVTNEAEA